MPIKPRSPNRPRWRSAQLQRLEPRHLMAAAPLGATVLDTGEFLVGKVLVTPVFLESNGQLDTESQNWEEQEIDDMLAKITEGVNWWSTALAGVGTVHTLDFVIDDTFAKDPFETKYEPIDRTSGTYVEYTSEFLIAQQVGDAPSLEQATKNFNDAQREKFDTDWAFTIFVADSSDDPNGAFAAGGQFSTAFAFAGGMFFIMPSTRPASTVAHELGHIFWARDEYPGVSSYTDRRGYYNAQNLNAADNPNSTQENSIMRGGSALLQSYQSFTSPESTLALIGWRDSDGDGIFDLADVPLDLDIVGYFDSESSTFHVSGSASAVPLINQNSSGNQSDITLNRISELQYRIDGANWQTAATPDAQTANIDVSIPISGSFDTIEFRVVDSSSGIASPVVSGTRSEHAISSGGVRGFAFLDEDSNAQRDATDSFLPGTQVTVTHQNGVPLFHGSVAATDFDAGQLPSLSGVTLTADGSLLSNQLHSLDSSNAGDARVFQAFDTQREKFVDSWSDTAVFEAQFDQVVGQVTIDTIGLSTGRLDIGSYARIEAYDSNGLLINRTTSELIAVGETSAVTVQDPLGQIARIRAFGHASTKVAISSIQFGASGQITVADNGAWQIDNLAAGEYQIQFSTQNVIHQADPIDIVVADGTSAMVVAAIDRVDSIRHNTFIAVDVNRDLDVTARDALLVINDINRNGSRSLSPSETNGHKIDVNNDGIISGLDALIVVNALGAPESEQPLGSWESTAEFTQAERTDAAISQLNDPTERWTNAPVAGSQLSSDWLDHRPNGPGMFNSAGQTLNNESIVPMTTDTRSDGVSPAIFSRSLPNTEPSQPGLKSSDYRQKGGENHQIHIKTLPLENHIESNLSEPILDSRV